MTAPYVPQLASATDVGHFASTAKYAPYEHGRDWDAEHFEAWGPGPHPASTATTTPVLPPLAAAGG